MEEESIPKPIAKSTRGRALTMQEFRERYCLTEEEAGRLFEKFGPYSIDLQVLMEAKLRKDLQTSAAALNVAL